MHLQSLLQILLEAQVQKIIIFDYEDTLFICVNHNYILELPEKGQRFRFGQPKAKPLCRYAMAVRSSHTNPGNSHSSHSNSSHQNTSSAAIERSSTSSAKASNAVQKEATGSKDLLDTKMGTSPAKFSTAEKGKQKQDLNPFGPSTSAKRLPPPTAKAVRELKGFLRNQTVQHTAKQKRIANEAATRVERLPNAANAIISNEKLDAYALAIEHPRGGDKAYDITRGYLKI